MKLRMLRVFIACLVVAIGSGNLMAGTKEAAVDDLLGAMQIEKQVDFNSITELIPQEKGPGTEAVGKMFKSMQDFNAKYMSWKVLKPEFAKIYSQAFTENEIRELLKFYKSPAGSKLAGKQPAILKEIAAGTMKSMLAKNGGAEDKPKDPVKLPAESKSDAARKAAAEELLLAMKAEEQYETQSKIGEAMQGNTGMAAKSAVAGIPGWKELKPEFVKQYSRNFSDAEIRELIKFYKSPIGVTLTGKQPGIMKEASKMIQDIMQKHMGELQDTVLKSMDLPPEVQKMAEAELKKNNAVSGNVSSQNKGVVTSGNYTFGLPADVTFSEKYGNGTFNWGVGATFMVIPSPYGALGLGLKDVAGKMKDVHEAAVKTLKEQKMSMVLKSEKEIKKGIFDAIVLEYSLQTEFGAVQQYQFILKDGNEYLTGTLTSTSPDDLSKVFAILESARKITPKVDTE